jgi:hypothetical protein
MIKCTKRQIRELRTALHWKMPEAQRQRIQMVLLRESGMTGRLSGRPFRGHGLLQSPRRKIGDNCGLVFSAGAMFTARGFSKILATFGNPIGGPAAYALSYSVCLRVRKHTPAAYHTRRRICKRPQCGGGRICKWNQGRNGAAGRRQICKVVGCLGAGLSGRVGFGCRSCANRWRIAAVRHMFRRFDQIARNSRGSTGGF